MQRSTLLIIAGILLIIASIISLILGVLLLESYFLSTVNAYYIYYASLTCGILNLVAVPLEIISGALLSTKKPRIAVTIVTIVLMIGLASPLILHFVGYLWETGLLFGSPMIVFSVVALILALLGQRTPTKQQTNPLD